MQQKRKDRLFLLLLAGENFFLTRLSKDTVVSKAQNNLFKFEIYEMAKEFDLIVNYIIVWYLCR